jgi:bla regulator protein BlaR1
MMPTDLSPLANHLWQSTLCVAAAWVLTLALRRNRAAVRYWLWMAASVKFLIPFSLLVSIGGQLGRQSALPITHPQLSMVMNEISRPFAVPTPALQAVTSPSSNPIPAILIALWICGFSVSIAVWIRCWRRIRSARHRAVLLPIDFPIPVLSSPARLEPGVFGILKPVLLLPEGITGRLTAAQLEAVLAHELCHVRRRDNLTGSIHLAVETVFWFFPLVWWMRARLVEERERACDEEVLRLGSEPQTYAEGILNVCKSYLAAPAHCVSGVTGSDLKKRVQTILTEGVGSELSIAKKVALTVAGMAALAAPVIVGMMSGRLVRAQSQLFVPWESLSGGGLMAPQILLQSKAASTPRFEVASIKIAGPSAPQHGRLTRMEALIETSPGLLNARNVTLRQLIEGAHSLDNYQVIGGPEWVDSARFEVQGKAAGGANRQQLLLMLGPFTGRAVPAYVPPRHEGTPGVRFGGRQGRKVEEVSGRGRWAARPESAGPQYGHGGFRQISHAFG